MLFIIAVCDVHFIKISATGYDWDNMEFWVKFVLLRGSENVINVSTFCITCFVWLWRGAYFVSKLHKGTLF